MEVKNDSLFKEPWKQGPFDSTITNQRRGRDSPGLLRHGFGFSPISDAMSMPVNDL
jgi:hypothetical protein